jgi:ribosomal protein L1
MATYKNLGGELVFPTLTDSKGNVLVVASGETFEALAGLKVAGVELVTTAKTKNEETE